MYKKCHKCDSRVLNDVFKRSELSWQERIAWFERIRLYDGPRGENFEYLMIRFNSEEVVREKLKVKSDRVLGVNNPAYGHDGRLSPFSRKFLKYESDEDYESGSNAAVRKKDQSVRDNPQNQPTRIEFWLAKGLSQEDAETALATRQATFTLHSCIEKYGEIEGLLRWNERQDKWQDTLNAKSDEEKEIINRKKGKDRHGNPHQGRKYNTHAFETGKLDKNIPGLLYYISFTKDDNTIYKIGITKNDVNSRWKSAKKGWKMDIIGELRDTIFNCFNVEQETLKLFDDVRIRNDELGSTELFSICILDHLKSIRGFNVIHE